jgi:hypothetical protein
MTREKSTGNESLTGTGHTSPEKIRKEIRQSNHEVYTLPAILKQWADDPLYLLISRWCLLQKRWISRNDIAAVFHMQERSASFQLSYISRKKSRVVCRTRYMKGEVHGRQRMEIFVDLIIPSQEEAQKRAPPPRKQTATVKQTNAASRRIGSAMKGNTGLWDQLLKGCREKSDEE